MAHVTVTGWDGAAPAVLTLLAAGHSPGLYLVAGAVSVYTPAAGALAMVTGTWSDDGIVEGVGPNRGLSEEGQFSLGLDESVVYSDGVDALVVTAQAAGDVTGLDATVRGVAFRVG